MIERFFYFLAKGADKSVTRQVTFILRYLIYFSITQLDSANSSCSIVMIFEARVRGSLKVTKHHRAYVYTTNPPSQQAC